MNVDVYDPHADKNEVKEEYGIDLIDSISEKYDAIILAVSHREFLELDIKAICTSSNSIIYDIKSFLERSIVDARL
jgi:UDP-N-acetyl-D-galactosamine dehydrogenase